MHSPESLRSESYYMYVAVTKDEENAADGRFSTASLLLNRGQDT